VHNQDIDQSCQRVLYYTVIVLLFSTNLNASWHSSSVVAGAACLLFILGHMRNFIMYKTSTDIETANSYL
jgi:hypothetical protein